MQAAKLAPIFPVKNIKESYEEELVPSKVGAYPRRKHGVADTRGSGNHAEAGQMEGPFAWQDVAHQLSAGKVLSICVRVPTAASLQQPNYTLAFYTSQL